MNVRLGNETDRALILANFPYTANVLGGGGYLIVTEQEDDIVGFCWAYKRLIPAPIEKDELFINVIEVFSESFRCQGVATQMLDKLKEVAVEEKVYQLRAYCDIRNVASHRLWVKNGYGINPVKMPDDTIAGSFVSLVL